MQTFERIRKISPYLFGLFAVLLVAYFVFTSGGEEITKSAMHDPAKAAIAEVNGEKILYSEYMKKVQQQIEQMRNQKNDKQPEVNETQIREQVFNQMIEETLIRQQAEKIGITVTDEELKDLLLENPPDYLRRGFTDTAGNFNKALYLDVVTNPSNLPRYLYPNPDQVPLEEKEKKVNDFRNDLIIITNYLRQQKLMEGLMSVVNTSESQLSPIYAKQNFEMENSNATVQYILLETKDVPDNTIKITDQDLKDYYEKHKKGFPQKESRKIKYVTFPILPSKDDTLKALKRVQRIQEGLQKGTTPEQLDSLFEVSIDQYNGTTQDFILAKDIKPEYMNYLAPLKDREVLGPVRLTDGTYFFRLDGRREGQQAVVKASHILIKFGSNKDSAKTEADRILKLAKGGSDFSMLARQFSEDKGSGEQGGDLGYFSKGQMVKPFEDAAFAAKPGEIVGPVESQFGYHIIKVEDKKSEELKYSEIKVDIKISGVTRNLIKREAASFKTQVDDGAKFDTIAARMKLSPIETPFFDKSRPVLGSQYLTDISFKNDVGTMLDPVELEMQGLVVAQIIDERQPGFKPLDDIKEEIKARVMNIKKLDVLKPKADQIYTKVASLQNLSQITATDPSIQVKTAEGVKGTGFIAGLGQQFVFAANAFKLPLNQISKPVRDGRGYFIMQVMSRIIPDKAAVDNQLPEYIKNLKNNMKASAYYQWFAKVRENADIKDNRSDYFREY